MLRGLQWLRNPRLRAARKALLALAALLVVALAAVLIALEVKRHSVVALPAPSGPYAVGRVAYDWTDRSRADPFAPSQNARRELVVWIWYPATATPGAKPGPYLPAAWARALEEGHGLGDVLFQSYDAVRAHAIVRAAFSPRRTRYPVLILEPGLGRIAPDYTTLAEDLASHGYVVAGITPTYSASVVVFPDGRTVQSVPGATAEDPSYTTPAAMRRGLNRLMTVWARDVVFVMNRLSRMDAANGSMFRGRLALARMGVFGHSFGGATAAQVCSADVRCKAGIDIDGDPYGSVTTTGLAVPFMFIHSETQGASDCYSHPCVNSDRDLRAMLRGTPAGAGFILSIKGTRHFNFTDDAVLFSPLLRPMGLLGSISGARGLRITAAYVRAFFDTYLEHKSSSLLRGPSRAYPEVRFAMPER